MSGQKKAAGGRPGRRRPLGTMISIVPTGVSQTGSWPRPWQVLASEMAVAVAAALALETALAVESALALGFPGWVGALTQLNQSTSWNPSDSDRLIFSFDFRFSRFWLCRGPPHGETQSLFEPASLLLNQFLDPGREI